MSGPGHKIARRIARLVVAVAAGIATFVLLLLLFDEDDSQKSLPTELSKIDAALGK